MVLRQLISLIHPSTRTSNGSLHGNNEALVVSRIMVRIQPALGVASYIHAAYAVSTGRGCVYGAKRQGPHGMGNLGQVQTRITNRSQVDIGPPPSPESVHRVSGCGRSRHQASARDKVAQAALRVG